MLATKSACFARETVSRFHQKAAFGTSDQTEEIVKIAFSETFALNFHALDVFHQATAVRSRAPPDDFISRQISRHFQF
jgi:hypothetical protein